MASQGPKRLLALKLRRIFLALVLLALAWKTPLTLADVIYLTNGNVVIVEKAWVEGDLVKYQTSTGVKILPASLVRKIQEQTPTQDSPGPAGHYGIAVEVPASGTVSSRPAHVSLQPTTGSKEISLEVVQRLQENLKSNPEDVQSKRALVAALNSLGALQYLKGDFAGARLSLQQALRMDSKNPLVLTNLAVLQYQRGEYREAEETLLIALQVEPSNQRVRYLLGEAYYAQDKIAAAVNIWKEALQMGPLPEATSRLTKAEGELAVHSQLGVLHSAHFILRYDREVSDYRIGQEILYALERSYRRLSTELAGEPPATIAVILYPNQAYFDITRAPQWTGGLYDGKIRLPIKGMTTVTAEIEAVLVHELTHSFVAAMARGGCPSWLNEGIAQVLEGKTAAQHIRMLAELQGHNQLVPLAELSGSWSGLPAEMAGVAYWEGLSAVEFVIAKNGRQVLGSLLDLLRQNYNLESAWQTATGQSLIEFEKNWRAFLLK